MSPGLAAAEDSVFHCTGKVSSLKSSIWIHSFPQWGFSREPEASLELSGCFFANVHSPLKPGVRKLSVLL